MNSPNLKPTVWDRLTNDAPTDTGLRGSLRAYGHRQVCESIRTELTRLLNTRFDCVGWSEDLSELQQSLPNYGVADYTGCNLLDATTCETMRREVEDAVRLFEPRLASVSVTLPDGVNSSSRSIRLRVNARLAIGEAADTVSFESRLDPRRRTFKVEVAGR